MHEISSKATTEADIRLIKAISGFDRIKTDFPDFLTDESRVSTPGFDLLFFPDSEVELSTILREMNRSNVPVTIAGARTGITGGSVPMEGAVISLEKLNQIESLYYAREAEEWRVSVQAAVNLNRLNQLIKTRTDSDLETNPDELVRHAFTAFKNDPFDAFYPPDPTEMSASIGGTVAANASGARTYRYGPTRAWVRGIRVFLANGEYLDIPRGKYFASPGGIFTIYDSTGCGVSFKIPDYAMPITKNAAGLYAAPQMDLIDLFIGSEGVLGVITRVELALLKREKKAAMIQFLASESQAIHLTELLRSSSHLHLDCIEFYSKNTLDLLREQQESAVNFPEMPEIPADAHSALFFEMDFDPEDAEDDLTAMEGLLSSIGADMANSWVGFNERDLTRFKAFRHLVPEIINRIIAERKNLHPAIHKLGTDLAVPDEYLAEIWELYSTHCEKSKLEWFAFGHIGNNHIHVNILPRDDTDLLKGLELFDLFARSAVAMGGTVSAEHGIGKIKHRYLQMMYTAQEIKQMRSVKAALDPNMILNRGNLFPVE